MDDTREEPEIIEYVPKNKSAVNWKIASPLLLGWIGILIAAMVMNIGTLHRIWPLFMVALVVYLVICTVTAYSRKKN